MTAEISKHHPAESRSTFPPPTFSHYLEFRSCPNVSDAGADSPVELGVKFKADTNGTIIGIRFYKSAAIPELMWESLVELRRASCHRELHRRELLGMATSELLHSCYHYGEYRSMSRRTILLSVIMQLIRITFKNSGVDNPPLHAVQSTGGSGGNGVFAYGTSSTFRPPASTPPIIGWMLRLKRPRLSVQLL